MKGFVARAYFPGRTIWQTLEDIWTGFYGGEVQLGTSDDAVVAKTDGCSPEICLRFINKMFKECNKTIKLDKHLTGEIGSESFGDDGLIDEDGLDEDDHAAIEASKKE
eukprot:TRINITY_DN3107_c0_g1_i1.p1 TRINITY_DN3107_c0_g1~~TRINITY_DN3107_c0_g1_i1.p1  ORF type:complete len:108 (-),score=36.68 TRINITY_DN3107_c0_g1_i1:62-385(-)